MPLILVSGYPCAGKTRRAAQLAEGFRTRIAAAPEGSRASRLAVAVISDHSLGISRAAYASARDEKQARGLLSSALRRALGPETIVVADAPNYIKGFRYQMYCEAKQVRTPSCVVHAGAAADVCRAANEARRQAGQPPGAAPPAGCGEQDPYDPELLENLIFRYEEPNGMARWDSPLFTVPHSDAGPPLDALWAALVGEEGAPVTARPNAATVLPKVAAPGALYALEKATLEVVARLGEYVADHPGESGGQVAVEGGEVQLPVGKPVTAGQLQRLRRHFVGLCRMQAGGWERSTAAERFVVFLNDTWAEDA